MGGETTFRKNVLNILENLFEKAKGDFTGLAINTQKVFISFCYGAERATTVTGIGNSLKNAFAAAANKCISLMDESLPIPKWIMLDIVNYEKAITVEEFYTMLHNNRRGYLRYGISFDKTYNIAFLEQEVYGNNLIKYVKSKNQYFLVDNIKACQRRKKKATPAFSMELDKATPLIIFLTLSHFYDEGEYIPLHNSTLHKGLRETDISKEGIEREIMRSGDYLLSTLKDDGCFTYGYFSCFAALVPGYNVPRHALATYSFADMYQLFGVERYKEAAIKSLDYILDNFIYHSDKDTAFVLDAPDKEGKQEIKLGALGIAIMAITKCIEIGFDDKKYIEIAKKIGNGILYMQNRERGGYLHVLHYPSLQVKDEFRIIYYDGEANFALAKLYSLDKNKKWLDVIEKTFDFFEKNNYEEHFDHWQAYAVAELVKHKDEDKYYEFGLKNAFFGLDFIIERDTPWHTFLEMLNVSYAIIQKIYEVEAPYLLKDYDINKIYEALTTRAVRQATSIMRPEMAMFFKKPDLVLYGIFSRHHSFRIRNDDVAHHLMGYCNYYRLKYGKGII